MRFKRVNNEKRTLKVPLFCFQDFMSHRLTVSKFDGRVTVSVTRDPCSLFVGLQATIMLAKNLNISIEFREISSVIQPGTLLTKQSSVAEFISRKDF